MWEHLYNKKNVPLKEVDSCLEKLRSLYKKAETGEEKRRYEWMARPLKILRNKKLAQLDFSGEDMYETALSVFKT